MDLVEEMAGHIRKKRPEELAKLRDYCNECILLAMHRFMTTGRYGELQYSDMDERWQILRERKQDGTLPPKQYEDFIATIVERMQRVGVNFAAIAELKAQRQRLLDRVLEEKLITKEHYNAITDAEQANFKYYLLEKLSAQVYRGEKRDGSLFALKITRRKSAVDSISELEHPFLCKIYEALEDPLLGNHIWVMRYTMGTPLRELLKTSHFFKNIANQQDAIGRLQKFAIALDYLHNQNILHLNLNPDNILFSANDEPTILWGSDFSIAAGESANSKADHQDIRYKAPELLEGDRLHKQTDLWSLAVIGYEMLAGQLPFKTQGEIKQCKLRQSDRVSALTYEVFCRAFRYKAKERFDTCLQFIDAINDTYSHTATQRFQ